MLIMKLLYLIKDYHLKCLYLKGKTEIMLLKLYMSF